MPQPPNEFDQLDDPGPHDRNASALAAEEAMPARDNLSKNNSFTPYTEVYDSLGDVILQTSLKLAA